MSRASSKSSKLLFDEYPLVVNPQLAKLIGLNEAIVLQQVHYWVTLNEKAERNFREGFYWTFNTLKEWHEQFPFWSEMTIRRTIKSLENSGYLISGNYNKMRADKTKWYRVVPELLASMNSPSVQDEHSPSAQNEQSNRSKRATHVGKVTRPLPETTSETSPKTIDIPSNKHKFGEFFNVYLTDEEHRKLIVEYGIDGALVRISELSTAIASKGYKYKSHYATILNWNRREHKAPMASPEQEVTKEPDAVIENVERIRGIFAKDEISDEDGRFLGTILYHTPGLAGSTNLYRIYRCVKGQEPANSALLELWRKALLRKGIEAN